MGGFDGLIGVPPRSDFFVLFALDAVFESLFLEEFASLIRGRFD